MIPERIVLLPDAVHTMRREMRQALLTETGGPLVGFWKKQTIIVSAATGPGPKGIRRPFYVKIDGEHASAFCVREFEASSGRADYVGDWHCHLSWTIKHSARDVEAMRILAESDSCPTRNPISVIWSKWRRRFVVAYAYDVGNLRELPVEVRS